MFGEGLSSLDFMDTTLQELLKSPRLERYAAVIGETLADERVRRQKFAKSLRDDEKAEFINGEIVRHMPTKSQHIQVVMRLQTLLMAHVGQHDLGYVGGEHVYVRLTRNDFMPDVSFFRKGRKVGEDPNQEYFPPPDFVAEVLSPSTAAWDQGVKLRDYADHEVGEYWVVDPENETVEVYVLREQNGEFFFGGAGHRTSGNLVSVSVPGFTIPVRALFDPTEHAATTRRLVVGG